MILFLFSNLFHWDSCWLLIGSTEKVGSLTWLRLEIIPRNRFPYIEAPSHSPGKSYLITVACLYLYVLCNAIHEYFQIFTSILLSETEQFSFLPSFLVDIFIKCCYQHCLPVGLHSPVIADPPSTPRSSPGFTPSLPPPPRLIPSSQLHFLFPPTPITLSFSS